MQECGAKAGREEAADRDSGGQQDKLASQQGINEGGRAAGQSDSPRARMEGRVCKETRVVVQRSDSAAADGAAAEQPPEAAAAQTRALLLPSANDAENGQASDERGERRSNEAQEEDDQDHQPSFPEIYSFSDAGSRTEFLFRLASALPNREDDARDDGEDNVAEDKDDAQGREGVRHAKKFKGPHPLQTERSMEPRDDSARVCPAEVCFPGRAGLSSLAVLVFGLRKTAEHMAHVLVCISGVRWLAPRSCRRVSARRRDRDAAPGHASRVLCRLFTSASASVVSTADNCWVFVFPVILLHAYGAGGAVERVREHSEGGACNCCACCC